MLPIVRKLLRPSGVSGVVIGLLLIVSGAGAQPVPPFVAGWPAHAIRLIVPYPAGGTTDVLARVLAERYSQVWGQPVVIDNRSGAAGLMGTEWAARAAPDGYTVVLGNNSTHAANAALFPQSRLDPLRDFAPVAFLASSRHALVVPAASPARNIADLVAMGRLRRLTFASSGVGSASHIIGQMLQMKAGIESDHIPYRGAGPAVIDLLSGQVDYMAATWASVSQQVETGHLRAIAIGAGSRSPGIAATESGGAVAIATFAAQGWPDLDLDAWFALFAPRGTPAPVIERFHAEAARLLAEPSAAERLRAIGFEPRTLSLPALASFFPREVSRWATLVRAAGVRLDQESVR